MKQGTKEDFEIIKNLGREAYSDSFLEQILSKSWDKEYQKKLIDLLYKVHLYDISRYIRSLSIQDDKHKKTLKKRLYISYLINCLFLIILLMLAI